MKVTLKSIKILRLIAKIISAIIIVFALIMFIGEAFEGRGKTTNTPMTFYSIIQLVFFGIGLLGLVIAWKWDFLGGIISLLAFTTIFIINPHALLWPMLIFPAISILFIIVAYLSKAYNSKVN